MCVCVYTRNLDESSDVSKQLTVKHVHILNPIANLQLWGWSGSQRLKILLAVSSPRVFDRSETL